MTEKVEVDINTEELDKQIGAQLADKLRGELELIDGVYPEFDKEEYLKGELAPVFFGSALNNFGVQELLDCFVEIAPSPRPVQAEEREVEPEEPKFTDLSLRLRRISTRIIVLVSHFVRFAQVSLRVMHRICMCVMERRCVFLRPHSSWHSVRRLLTRLGRVISSACRITVLLRSAIR